MSRVEQKATRPMPKSDSASVFTQNRILRALPPDETERWLGRFERVGIEFKELFYEQDKPVRHVYFPLSGVASVVTAMKEGGEIVETGTIGREGFVGLPVLH